MANIKKILSVLSLMFLILPALANAQWTPLNSPVSNVGPYINNFYSDNNFLYAGKTNQGLNISSNNGLSWSSNILEELQIFCFLNYNSKLWCGTSDGFYTSTNNGFNWTFETLPNVDIYEYILDNNTLYIASEAGVLKSTSNGHNWINMNLGINAKSIIKYNEAIIAYCDTAIFRSTDNGNSWSNVFTYYSGLRLNIINNRILALGANYISDDGGLTWIEAPQLLGIYNIFKYINTFYAGKSNGLFKTTDNGNSWLNVDFQNIWVNKMISHNNFLYLSTGSGIQYTEDSLSSWSYSPLTNSIYEATFLWKNESTIIAGLYQWIYRSSNSGISWEQIFSDRVFHSIIKKENTLYAGTSSGFLYSTNDGINWVRPTSSPFSVFYLDSIQNNLICCNGYAIYCSTNNGNNWLQTGSGTISGFTQLNNKIIAADMANLQYSTNGGLNWISKNNNIIFPRAITTFNNDIYIGEDYIFKSTNEGDNWSTINNTAFGTNCFLTFDNTIIAGSNNGIYISTNGGTNWLIKNEGMNNIKVNSLTQDENTVYASTINGIFKMSKTKLLDIENITSEYPHSFKLLQNYPNPFNPVTTIKFNLPKPAMTQIKIYDITGKLIRSLINEYKTAGSYSINFNASNLSAGVYFYSITSGNYKDVKKMVLVK